MAISKRLVCMIALLTGAIIMISPTIVAAQTVSTGVPQVELTLTDKNGNKQTSKNNRKQTERKILRFIDESDLGRRKKAAAKKQVRKMVAALPDNSAAKGSVTCTAKGSTSGGASISCSLTINF